MMKSFSIIRLAWIRIVNKTVNRNPLITAVCVLMNLTIMQHTAKATMHANVTTVGKKREPQ